MKNIVSIPFKREGSFRHDDKVEREEEDLYKFQFPSNGKAHSDRRAFRALSDGLRVSIPFKREGSFRRGEKAVRYVVRSNVSIPFKREGSFRLEIGMVVVNLVPSPCFNSLQTGRLIQTNEFEFFVCYCGRKFQFPSNGKAHSDLSSCKTLLRYSSSFNSLQTGRHIQTCSSSNRISGVHAGFHSLQTGRHIQTETYYERYERHNRFPFPSNGKAHSD